MLMRLPSIPISDVHSSHRRIAASHRFSSPRCETGRRWLILQHKSRRRFCRANGEQTVRRPPRTRPSLPNLHSPPPAHSDSSILLLAELPFPFPSSPSAGVQPGTLTYSHCIKTTLSSSSLSLTPSSLMKLPCRTTSTLQQRPSHVQIDPQVMIPSHSSNPPTARTTPSVHLQKVSFLPLSSRVLAMLDAKRR